MIKIMIYDLRSRNRQILSERFSHEELKGCYGRVEEAEGILQRGDASSVPETKTEKTGDKRLGKTQENLLEDWEKVPHMRDIMNF